MSSDFIEAIRTRRSVRNYRSDPVEESIIREIVDCGRLAATARNVQPWEFVVVRDRASRERLAAVAEYGKFISQAPVCVVVLCKDCKYYLEDGCAAVENILLAAWARGVGSCWVAGDKKDYADEIVRLVGAPDGYRLVALISLGYPQEPAAPPKKRPLEDVLHWEKF